MKSLAWFVVGAVIGTVLGVWDGVPSDLASHCERASELPHLMSLICWFRDPGAWTALATLLLFVATCLLGWLAYQQNETTRDIADRQDRTSRAQLRAYLFPDEPRIENVSIGGVPKAFVRLKNFGATPAYAITIVAEVGLSTYPSRTKQGMTIPSDVSRADMGPGGKLETQVPLGRPLTQQDWDAIKGKRAALYVFGTARFTDAFDVEWEYKFQLMQTYRNLGTTALEVCPEGNETRQL